MWRKRVSETWVIYLLGSLACGLACKIWIDNRIEILRLVEGLRSSSYWW